MLHEEEQRDGVEEVVGLNRGLNVPRNHLVAEELGHDLPNVVFSFACSCVCWRVNSSGK